MSNVRYQYLTKNVMVYYYLYRKMSKTRDVAARRLSQCCTREDNLENIPE